jgi:hypothetical protein
VVRELSCLGYARVKQMLRYVYTYLFLAFAFLREYSDSGEELSDDDIEIDYEDDEDDEEVEEVKPLPPVARSVYKKND